MGWCDVSAQQLFQAFVDGCYPSPLQLEVEERDGEFDLLESSVTASLMVLGG